MRNSHLISKSNRQLNISYISYLYLKSLFYSYLNHQLTMTESPAILILASLIAGSLIISWPTFTTSLSFFGTSALLKFNLSIYFSMLSKVAEFGFLFGMNGSFIVKLDIWLNAFARIAVIECYSYFFVYFVNNIGDCFKFIILFFI